MTGTPHTAWRGRQVPQRVRVPANSDRNKQPYFFQRIQFRVLASRFSSHQCIQTEPNTVKQT
jgi:hypothetical protein